METSPTASCSGSAVHREAGACVVSVQPPVEASLGMDEEQHSLPSCKRHRGYVVAFLYAEQSGVNAASGVSSAHLEQLLPTTGCSHI